MIPVPSGVRVWLAVGHTDMRRGMNSLAVQVQEVLKRDPHAGDLYVFRGRRGHLIKILWHDGIVPLCQAAGARPLSVAIAG
jgi:transposase